MRFHHRNAACLLGLCAALLAWLGSPSPVHADSDPTIEIGPYVGGHFFSDSNELGRYEKASNATAPEHALTFGLRLGVAPIPRLSLEGEVGLIPSHTNNSTADLWILTWRAHVLVHLV